MQTIRQAKDVIALAKQYIADVYGDEGAFNIGLEELSYDEGIWQVTLGFSREWDRLPATVLSGMAGRPALARVFKALEIEDFSGQVRGIKDRPLAA